MVDDIAHVMPFIQRELLPENPIELQIYFEFCDEEGIDGYCLQESKDDYIIELASHLKGEDLFRAVIHEMVHVRQYIDGKLEQIHKDGKGPRMYWENLDMTDILYEERPWEREAQSLEDRLFKKFLSK